MKKILTLVTSVTILIACEKNETSKGLLLSGEVDGFKQGKLYLHKVADTVLLTIDSITIKGDSHFTANIELSEPEMLYLSLDRGASNSMDNLLPFFAEPGNMTITTTLAEFYSKAKITGSKNQELLEKYNQTRSIYTDEQNKAIGLALLAKKEQSIHKIDSLNQVKDKMTVRKYLNAVNFAVNNGKHAVAPYIALTEIPNANIKLLDTIQKTMSPEVAKSKYGKLLTQYVSERKKTEQP